MDSAPGNLSLKFGLIGRHIDYSFSRSYFTEKFKSEGLSHSYVNFDIADLTKFKAIIKYTPHLKGLNVTIPYKEQIIPLLDALDTAAQEIGAVNTIKIGADNALKGFNTDYIGFKNSLKPYLNKHHDRALILGTGGASKAVAYSLKQLDIAFSFASRQPKHHLDYNYHDLNETIITNHTIIINCTPLGTFPRIEECPDIPYEFINNKHLLYDLIYNPKETKFLMYGKSHGANTINGLNMLKLQAEAAWDIWNTPNSF